MDSSGSRIEVEIKLAMPSVEEAIGRLRRLPSIPRVDRRFERNDVYDTAGGALAGAGRLLRVRQVDAGGLLTYKEPAAGEGKAKVRAEIETRVESPEALRSILEKTGFRRVYRYEKYRSDHVWRDEGSGLELVISLDETPIGVFVELEGAQAAIDRAAGRMGFGEPDYIVQDYRSLHAAWLREHGLSPGEMLFEKREGLP